MNTWGGFVQYGITDVSSLRQAEMDEGQFVQPAHKELEIPPEFTQLTPLSHVCETIPENAIVETHHPNDNYFQHQISQDPNLTYPTSYHQPSPLGPAGAAQCEDLSDESTGSEVALLPRLSIQDILQLDHHQSDNSISDLDSTEIPQIIISTPLTEFDGLRNDSGASSLEVLKIGQQLPGFGLTSAVGSSASSAATSPDRELPGQAASRSRHLSRKSPSKRRRSTGPVDSAGFSSSDTSPSAKHRASYPRCSDIETDDSSNEPDGWASGASHSDASDLLAGDASMDIDIPRDVFSGQLTNKFENMELCILKQPEANHRARYRTEGSRGCVKDRTGLSCPTVQLRGMTGNETAVLQVFAGSEMGCVQPHHLYCVSRAGGKKTSPCRELESSDGTFMLEMDFHPAENWIAKADCLGIMKLRNTDIKEPEKEANPCNPGTKKIKRSRKLRLVFQAVITQPTGRIIVMQAVSTPLSCTPLPGFPEIHHLSHQTGVAAGGQTIVIIGRNFIKDESKFYVIEKSDGDAEKITWEREIVLHPEHFQNVHVVGTIPAYHNLYISQPISAHIVVRNKAKQSESFRFTYMPAVAPPLVTRPVQNVSIMPVEPIPPVITPRPTTLPSVSQKSSIIQLHIQPDQNNPAGHVILISVPDGATFTPVQQIPIASPAAGRNQIANGHHNVSHPDRDHIARADSGDSLPAAGIPFELHDMKEQLKFNEAAEKANQKLFNELLSDIMGVQR